MMKAKETLTYILDRYGRDAFSEKLESLVDENPKLFGLGVRHVVFTEAKTQDDVRFIEKAAMKIYDEFIPTIGLQEEYWRSFSIVECPDMGYRDHVPLLREMDTVLTEVTGLSNVKYNFENPWYDRRLWLREKLAISPQVSNNEMDCEDIETDYCEDIEADYVYTYKGNEYTVYSNKSKHDKVHVIFPKGAREYRLYITAPSVGLGDVSRLYLADTKCHNLEDYISRMSVKVRDLAYCIWRELPGRDSHEILFET